MITLRTNCLFVFAIVLYTRIIVCVVAALARHYRPSFETNEFLVFTRTGHKLYSTLGEQAGPLSPLCPRRKQILQTYIHT